MPVASAGKEFESTTRSRVSRPVPNSSHFTRDIRFCNLQELSGLNAKSLRKTADDVETCVEGAFLELAEIAAAYVRLIGQFILRDALCMAQSSQIGGERLPQIHAASEANCAIYSTSIY